MSEHGYHIDYPVMSPAFPGPGGLTHTVFVRLRGEGAIPELLIPVARFNNGDRAVEFSRRVRAGTQDGGTCCPDVPAGLIDYLTGKDVIAPPPAIPGGMMATFTEIDRHLDAIALVLDTLHDKTRQLDPVVSGMAGSIRRIGAMASSATRGRPAPGGLSEAQRAEVVAMVEGGQSRTAVAAHFGIKRPHVDQIIRTARKRRLKLDLIIAAQPLRVAAPEAKDRSQTSDDIQEGQPADFLLPAGVAVAAPSASVPAAEMENGQPSAAGAMGLDGNDAASTPPPPSDAADDAPEPDEEPVCKAYGRDGGWDFNQALLNALVEAYKATLPPQRFGAEAPNALIAELAARRVVFGTDIDLLAASYGVPVATAKLHEGRLHRDVDIPAVVKQVEKTFGLTGDAPIAVRPSKVARWLTDHGVDTVRGGAHNWLVGDRLGLRSDEEMLQVANDLRSKNGEPPFELMP